MNTHQIKGYCPGALNAMPSGDGLVVRIRPFNGQLSRDQAKGIASLAAVHGNGLIDLSSRGNLQIRGVTEQSYATLISGLRNLSLIDDSEVIESRRNVLVAPFWHSGDETEYLAAALTKALSTKDAPALPGKFGFAVDTGRAPVLQTASADIRFERDADGALILCAEGAKTGKEVNLETLVPEALGLALWFMETRADHTRMQTLLDQGAALPEGFTAPRQAQDYVPTPSNGPQGALVGCAFGQLTATSLGHLASLGGMRMTPWRMVLVEGAQNLPAIDGILTDPANPLLRISACTGAPACAQGLAQTRPIAHHLAPHLKPDQTLHVSGCTKGCAHPRSAPVTFIATTDGFDLIRNGRTGDPPLQTQLTLKDMIKAL